MKKRIVSIALAICLLMSLLPTLSMQSDAAEGWLWPVETSKKIISNFGMRYMNGEWKFHSGIDISCPIGTEVRAAKSGTVCECYFGFGDSEEDDGRSSMSSFGNYVAIKHTDGYSIYAHLKQQQIVNVGTTVSQGQKIAYSGNSGYSTGAHCHFQATKNPYPTWSNAANLINTMPTVACINSNGIDVEHDYVEASGYSTERMTYIFSLDTPSKPALKDFSRTYNSGSATVFTWDSTTNTTHYNMYVDRQETGGTWTRIYNWKYMESGYTWTFEDGIYRVLLQSVNSNVTGWPYADADWVTFVVGPHEHDRGRYLYWEDTHPHRNCYECSVCGAIWADQGSSNYINTCLICNPHTHDKGKFVYFEKSHPHCNCYECSICGAVWRDTSSSNYYEPCLECHRPDKPVIAGLNESYEVQEPITIRWTYGANTTHCNYWLYSKDGDSWRIVNRIDYATSPVTETLNEGDYCVLVVATNSNYWEADNSTWLAKGSDYAYFSVGVTRPKYDYGDFYAHIVHEDSGMRVVNQIEPHGRDVGLRSEGALWDTNYLWHFESLGSGFYRIVNEYDGRILTASLNETTSLGGKVVYLSDEYCFQNSTQTWFITSNSSGVHLVSLETGLFLDLYNADQTEGNYFHLWSDNGTNAQNFCLEFVPDYQGLQPIKAPNVYTWTSGSNVSVLWTESPLTSSTWDYRSYHVVIEKDNAVVLDTHTEERSIEGDWMVGTYYVTVTAENWCYSDERSGARAIGTGSFSVTPLQITFDACGGTVGITTKYVEYNQPYGELPVAYRDGFTFLGWFDSEGTQITSDSIVPFSVDSTASKTLYAHWTSNCVVAGHNYQAVVTAPTCTEGGYTTYTCLRCGDSYVADETAALGHTPGAAVEENRVNPTCTANGGFDTVTYCSVCGVELTRVHTDVAALGHAWDDGVIDPIATCTSDGVKTFTCQRCGETKTEAIAATGHTSGESAKENEVAATCTTAGGYDMVIRCTVCNAILYTEHLEIAALGHDYQAAVTAPTCTEGGYTTCTCSRCGDSYTTDEKPATGHNFVDGMCTVCGAADPDYKPDDPQPPVTENPFVDVAETAYYFEPVMWAVDNGVTGGIDETHFGPNKPCTRAQVVMFLYSAAGKPSLVGDGAHDVPQNPFVDVKATAYYHDAVLWAFGKGITGGVDATHFGPNKTCTRAQVVTFLYSWKGKPAYTATENPFDDVKTTAYYYDAVMWAVENGVTGGTGPRTFGPNKNCTRCQVVTFLYKAK